MSKYIIEIKPEYEDSFKGLMILGAKDSNLFVDTLAVENLEELNSDYINEHFGDLQDTAYQKGFEDGRTVGIKDGMCDAWEAARNIHRMPEGDILNLFPDCYASVCTAAQAILKYDAAEAIEELKAYEEKQKADDKIEVRDEVVWTEDENVVIVVTSVYTADNMEWCDGVTKDGKAYSILTKNARKTGRRFDIDKILEKMNE